MVVGGSLGGTKPKAVISIDGEEWVLKFFNGEPFDLPLVERATMTLAHERDITEIAAFVDAPDLLAQRLPFSIAAYTLKSPTQKKPRPGAKVFR